MLAALFLPFLFIHCGNLLGDVKTAECHRITGSLKWERTSGDHLVPAHRRVEYSRLLKALSRHVLSISKDGDSIAFLGNLFEYLTTLKEKKMKNKISVFKQNLLYLSLYPLPLVLPLDITERILTLSALLPTSDIYTY